MSVYFHRFNNFHPLLRLADELERTSRPSNKRRCQAVRTFSPRFDVKETAEGYELYGELPGIDQSNVNIEWADEHTLVVFGKNEQRHESSSENKDNKDNKDNSDEQDDFVDVAETAEEATESSETYHKPTVEEEGAEGASSTTADETPAKEAEPEKPKQRYWVTERSYGSFRRTFTFSGRVDQDNVKASLKNGVLSVTIPKAKALEPRKIYIN